ncbi:hypothetical protein RLOatenuis_7780 [Rickettsiales bacterium]|nr:hypothetical protein RLOatenuis_7780 [Rickettsiales bacterium]
MDNCKIVGVFDPKINDSNLEGFMKENGLDDKLKIYGNYDELAKDDNVDAVFIGTPDKFHLEQLQKAVENRKHVFCEKPLCTNTDGLKTLKEVLDAAEEKGLKVTTCHSRRFDPPYVWLKEKLPDFEEKYGKVIKVELDFSYHLPSKNERDMHEGSLLLDHASHEIDYLNFLLGVSGVNLTKLKDCDEHYELLGVRDDKVTTSFIGTRLLTQEKYPEEITVRFAKATLTISMYDAGLSRLSEHEKIIHQTSEDKEPSPNPAIEHPVTDYDSRFIETNKAWLESIIKSTDCYLTKEEMLFNTAVCVGFSEKGKNSLRVNAGPSTQLTDQNLVSCSADIKHLSRRASI